MVPGGRNAPVPGIWGKGDQGWEREWSGELVRYENGFSTRVCREGAKEKSPGRNRAYRALGASRVSAEQTTVRHPGGASAPRVAIVHDYLTQRGGAERVVLSLCKAFPDAPVYSSFYHPEGTFPEFGERDVRPLWLDRAGALRKRHRVTLPVLPFVFSTSRVDADVVICSTSGFAHGIRTRGQKLVYCHSPAKWLYRRDDYLGAHPSKVAPGMLRLLSPFLRSFDRRAAQSADKYLASSTFVASQIDEVYGIEAEVLFPPGGLATEGPCEPVAGVAPGFLLMVARLMAYKNVAQVIEAFRRLPELELVIVGQGPERDTLVADTPDNVKFVGGVSDATLRWLYMNCAGLVAASREDFGLTSVEAASFGKPVAALRWGGFLDTVIPYTGVFFDTPEAKPIAQAVHRLLGQAWNETAIRKHAEAFSELRFIDRMRRLVDVLHARERYHAVSRLRRPPQSTPVSSAEGSSQTGWVSHSSVWTAI